MPLMKERLRRGIHDIARDTQRNHEFIYLMQNELVVKQLYDNVNIYMNTRKKLPKWARQIQRSIEGKKLNETSQTVSSPVPQRKPCQSQGFYIPYQKVKVRNESQRIKRNRSEPRDPRRKMFN